MIIASEIVRETAGGGGEPPKAKDIESWLVNVEGKQAGRVTASWLFAVSQLLFIGFALGLYEVLREAGASAWLALASFVVGAVVSASQGILEGVMVSQLAPAYVAADATNQPLLAAEATSVLMMQLLGFGLGSFLVFLGMALFALAIFQTSVFRRWTVWLGVVGPVLAVIGFGFFELSTVFVFIALLGFAMLVD